MKITGNKSLDEARLLFNESGKIFSEIGLMFKDVQTMDNINEKVELASQQFNEIAGIEEKAYVYLEENIGGSRLAPPH